MGAIIFILRVLLEQRCPTRKVFNSSRMVAGASKLEECNHDSLPDHSVARAKSRRARNPLGATASVLAAQSRTGSPVDGVSSDRTCARRPVLRFRYCFPAGDSRAHRICGRCNQGCRSPCRENHVTDDVSMSPGNTESCLPPSLYRHRRKQRDVLSPLCLNDVQPTDRQTPNPTSRHWNGNKITSARKGNILGTFDGNRSDV